MFVRERWFVPHHDMPCHVQARSSAAAAWLAIWRVFRRMNQSQKCLVDQYGEVRSIDSLQLLGSTLVNAHDLVKAHPKAGGLFVFLHA